MGQPAPTFHDVICAIYGEDFDPRTIHHTSFSGDPHDKESAHWHGNRLSGRMLPDGRTVAPLGGDANHFLCMGLMDPLKPGRSLRHVIGHVAFWMDDIGTKTPQEKVDAFIKATGLEPVLVVQTSPGNRSYTWAFERVMEDGSFEAQTVAAVRHGLKVGGWGDPATQEPARYMRSGFGINGKAKYRELDGSPFKVEIVEFNPGARLLDAGRERFAREILGPDWKDDVQSGKYLSSAHLAAQAGGGAGSSNDRRATMDDPLVKLAAAIGLDPQPSTRPGVIDCHCPNEGAHTGGDPTGYAIINDGMSFCNHASCQHLNSVDFQEMMIEAYDARIEAGKLFGTIIDNPFGPGLIEAGTGEVLPASTGSGFLAVARFEGVSTAQGVDPKQARHDAIEQAEELAQRKAEKTRQKEADRDALLDQLYDRFVYVDAGEVFWDRKISELVSPSRLDRDEEVLKVFPLKTGEKRASNLLLNAVGRMEHVHNLVVQPYRADRKPNTDIVTIDGPGGKQRAINTFKPTRIGFRPGIPQKFIDHLDFLFGSQPDVRDYLLEYMAFCVQHPAVKTSVIPLIGGPPGIGKDLLLQAFFKLLGTHNVTSISAAKLSGNFNEYLLSPVIHMGEFSLAGRDGDKAYDRLKEFSSPNPVPVEINPKYGKTFKTEVGPKFIATTNNRDSLAHVDDEDRRIFVAWTDAVRLIGPGYGSGRGTDPYYDDIAAYLTDIDNLEMIHHYLMNLPIKNFNPNKAPPRTAARHETLVASLSGVARFVYDLMTDGDFAGRKVVTFTEIEARALGAENPAVRSHVHHWAIARGLHAAGCQKIARTLINGKQVQLWTGSCVVVGGGAVLRGALAPAEKKDLVDDLDLARVTFQDEQLAAANTLVA
jgi:hypothetical protein